MRKIIVIPARMESTRLPSKLMLPYKGKPIIKHTIENALSSVADYVFLASDNDELLKCANGYGASCFPLKTGHCNNGTERVVQGMKFFGLRDDDIVINLQGDCPLLGPEYLDEMFDALKDSPSDVVTLAHKTTDFGNPSIVKIVLDMNNEAMYFSRLPIPFGADVCLEHIGVYGFKKRFFDQYDSIMQIDFAKENLEQLSWLHHGLRIRVNVVNYGGFSIDTQDDYQRLLLT